MVQETRGSRATPTSRASVTPTWLRGLSAGLLGGFAMGILLALAEPSTFDEVLPALVGQSGGGVGWLVHLCGAALLAITFSTLIARRPPRPLSAVLVAGIAFGVGLWFVLAGLAVPLWLGIVGVDVGITTPWLEPAVLAGLLIYGVVVALTHWLLG